MTDEPTPEGGTLDTSGANVEAAEPATTSPGETLAEAQDAGHFGTDAAEEAGDGDAAEGTQALREDMGDAKIDESKLVEGETLPDFPPGHPADPTVPTSAGSAGPASAEPNSE